MSDIVSRGQDYFQGSSAALEEVGETSASLKVEGTKLYNVRFDWGTSGGTAVSATCDCPFYQDGAFCKHVWAAILVLDEQGIGTKIPDTPSAKLIHSVFQRTGPTPRQNSQVPVKAKPKPIKKPWLTQLKAIRSDVVRSTGTSANPSALAQQNPASRTAYYRVDIAETERTGSLTIDFYHSIETNDASDTEIRIYKSNINISDLPLYRHSEDREILSVFLNQPRHDTSYLYYGYQRGPSGISQSSAPQSLELHLARQLIQTKRLFCDVENNRNNHFQEFNRITLDPLDPWRLKLSINKDAESFYIVGSLFRNAASLPIYAPLVCTSSGLMIIKNQLTQLERPAHHAIILKLRKKGFAPVPLSDEEEFVETLYSLADLPPVVWSENTLWRETKAPITPEITLQWGTKKGRIPGVVGVVKFRFQDQLMFPNMGASVWMDYKKREIIKRSLAEEQSFLRALKAIKGLVMAHHGTDLSSVFQVDPENLNSVVSEIIALGGRVLAENQELRVAKDFKMALSSGIDWFSLEGEFRFSGNVSIKLPELLAAIKKGQTMIPLGDGTFGMLPTDWMQKYAPLAQMGESVGDGIQFKRNQGALLAAWLEHAPEIKTDQIFSKLVNELESIQHLKPESPSDSFKGTLREYQKAGLGWLETLRNLGIGGVLADDMGLGKTVQVLAHLEVQHTAKNKTAKRPSLIVVPKSLLFNWKEEALRFTPNLKTLVYHGTNRSSLFPEIETSDLVFVTYATLRQDFDRFQPLNFHYVVADEAQAIKNSESFSFKSIVLLKSTYRLAMTGTPIENSVEDLFSLLEFTNPGLLGPAMKNRVSRSATQNSLEGESLSLFSKAIKPFILRRTKDQVVDDLPEKTEKVLYCELTEPESEAYNNLREYYRVHLQTEIKKRGLAKSKIVVLEALLRLRQAACHPGLIDKKQRSAESAKVDVLMTQVQELIAEGHKTLIFSQFTSFLDIVEAALKKQKIEFERLDGKTSMDSRKERVTRFQTDDQVKVFLVSLKAGGVGLNLTAADYVFILDPWWNPAAEAQAIDRSHRIGQQRKVIAYRLIAKDTVEEKILELQKSKRALADALISADASLMKKLTAQDLEILLS